MLFTELMDIIWNVNYRHDRDGCRKDNACKANELKVNIVRALSNSSADGRNEIKEVGECFGGPDGTTGG